MKGEIWKDIDGFPGYQVSSFGRVKNKTSGLILKCVEDKQTGYLRVNLWKNGIGSTKNVHRLVAESFIENPKNKRLVNHKDCNKSNNNISNLEWATDSENMKHAFENGLCENTRKSARIQQEKLSKMPRTQRQIEAARENIVQVNKRPKTEKQIEVARKNINSQICRERAKESHYNRHPPIRLIETGEVFRSQRELANKLGIDESGICDCLHGRRNVFAGYHFEYVKENDIKSFLYPHQRQAIDRMFTGCILNGGVGSGKSRTALYYYFKQNGGSIDPEYSPMKGRPQDLYIITTAKKRNDLEWLEEMIPFLLSTNPDQNKHYGNKVVVDSWQNIQKYDEVTNSFFIFDEDKITGKGAWAKSFLKIAKSNDWIVLSATSGDCWDDYETIFIANGFYKNRTEFRREHCVYSRFSKFPKIERYINERRLIRLRDKLLIDMDFERHTVRIEEDIYVGYDLMKYKEAIKKRWDPYKDEPIQQAASLCYVLRRIVNEDESRQVALLELFEKHPKMIIFYSFDYEREILLNLAYGDDVEIAEYSGHAHQPVPKSDKWVYLCQYTSSCEGFNCITTDTIVFFSQNYSYKMVEQARGRIDRLNTPYTDLYYYHVKSRAGIDLAISKALKNKKKFNERKFAERWN